MMLRLPFLGDSEVQAKARLPHAALIQEGVGPSRVAGRSKSPGHLGPVDSSLAHPELHTAQGH